MLTATDVETDVEAAAPEPVRVPPPQPTAPPLHALAAHAPARRRRGLARLTTPVCFGVSLALFAAGVATAELTSLDKVAGVAFIAASVTFLFATLVALVRAVAGILSLVVPDLPPLHGDVSATFVATIGNLVMTGLGMLVAYISTIGFARGRQLRRWGRVLLPEIRPERDWAKAMGPTDIEDVPPGVADQWRENGKTEHASVAAFARLTLDLMALGAPPRLIAASNQDALDEIRHTELCFSLASALDGRRLGPAPFPQAQRVPTLPRSRTLALARLAVDSLIDGALHEGVSARIIARLARVSDVPTIRAVLREIAADEGRHSAHGWWVVEWCLQQGGRPVADALCGAVGALPDRMRSGLPVPARDGGWQRWGIHGHALESEEYAAARAHVIGRVRSLVGALARDAA